MRLRNRWLTPYPAWRVVRASSAVTSFWATCGVTLSVRRHSTKSVVGVLVRAERGSTAPGNLLGHGPGGLPLRASCGLGEPAIHHEPVAILDAHVPEVAELGLVPRRLLEEERVGVGDRSMRGVAALLTVEVDRRIPR